ncbi:MAG: hypothetical protein ACO1NS_12505 [Daejeonella sp.]|uniref:hypothetical protein n=1 Tax=Daejeonella sp. JGW-45 TaxID=3034148 RepID=UPI0023EDAB06|nr:hypothetical protein [Daejeonella sp. JGW-45]
MKRTLIILFLVSAFSAVSAQNKLEREYRIKQSEVPAKALEFVESSFKGVKIKWYGEENLDGKAIEAKGKRDGRLYSIKFDTNGVLHDIEMVIKFGDIPEGTRLRIEKNLQDRFSRYSIQKTQKQWLGATDDLRALAEGKPVSGQYSTNYEISLQGTKDRRTDYFEVLANADGEIVRESKIVQRNNQHLIY